jgi:hypothetical protein
MIQQASSRKAVIWDAIVLGAAILAMVVAGAYHFSVAATRTGGAIVARYDEAAIQDETDGVGTNPAANGSIIIECMAFGDRVVPDVGPSKDSTTPVLVTVPRYQLGPSTCWHDPHQRS